MAISPIHDAVATMRIRGTRTSRTSQSTATPAAIEANQAPKSTCLSSETNVWIRAWEMGTIRVASANIVINSLSADDAARIHVISAPANARTTNSPVRRQDTWSTETVESDPRARDSVELKMLWTYSLPPNARRSNTMLAA